MEIKENFIVIQGWMVSELQLKGNELIIYACIHGLTQDGESKFQGGLNYLATWTNSTKQGVIRALTSLIEKGLIAKEVKEINGVRFCSYYSTKFNGVLNKVEWGIKQSLPNNIVDTISNNITPYNPPSLRSGDYTPTPKKDRFAPPSVDDVRQYCQERNNNVDAERFVDFYASKGWKVGSQPMKDWKAAVRTWEKRDKPKKEKPRYGDFDPNEALNIALQRSYGKK